VAAFPTLGAILFNAHPLWESHIGPIVQYEFLRVLYKAKVAASAVVSIAVKEDLDAPHSWGLSTDCRQLNVADPTSCKFSRAPGVGQTTILEKEDSAE
jgi:hypothetical protein